MQSPLAMPTGNRLKLAFGVSVASELAMNRDVIDAVRRRQLTQNATSTRVNSQFTLALAFDWSRRGDEPADSDLTFEPLAPPPPSTGGATSVPAIRRRGGRRWRVETEASGEGASQDGGRGVR